MVFAHFEDRPEKGERRQSVRRALKLGVGSAADSVTIRDISLTGMLLEASTPMLVGASFEVDLPHAGEIGAVVVWNSGEFYGCEFEHPISPAAVSAARLRSPPEDSPTGRSAPRDPLTELRELNAEMEELAVRIDRAIERLNDK